MIVSEYLKEKLAEMRGQLETLRPAYLSYVELERAIAALERAAEGRGHAPPGARRPAVPASRAEQAMQLLAAEPGLTVNALAARLGTARSYADRVLGALEKEGRAERREAAGPGRERWGYWPKG